MWYFHLIFHFSLFSLLGNIVHAVFLRLTFQRCLEFMDLFFPLDIPIHSKQVLPLTRSASRSSVRSCHRHVEFGMYSS